MPKSRGLQPMGAKGRTDGQRMTHRAKNSGASLMVLLLLDVHKRFWWTLSDLGKVKDSVPQQLA